MPERAELIAEKMADFDRVQSYLEAAEKENATVTYALILREYHVIKATLENLSVNLTSEIDRIKK